ncbi:hypothetical protein NL108_012201 [Boleophthalmus pectinirostris]|nr:hypothetical protein NL108_012201 [Boleophthalmus pectinirostris]
MSPCVCVCVLLLLAVCQSQALYVPPTEEEAMPPEDLTVDISQQILTSNNNSDVFLLDGDLLPPKNRNAMRCSWGQSCLWPKGSDGLVTIPYTINSEFSSYERNLMDQAMQAFHRYTCVRLVPRQSQSDYISIENQSGCFSSMGRQGGRQVLSLNRQGCVHPGVIQHEINHALGFHHEQNRSDRDSYVTINWNNVDQKMAYNFHLESTNNLNTPYDYSSIMHYGRTAFSINGQDTITPKRDPNISIGQRQGLSFWDVQRINMLYSCPK